MSEVSRYHVQLFKLSGDQQKYAHGALGSVEIVRASDYDAAQSELAALREELEIARSVMASQGETISRVVSERDGAQDVLAKFDGAMRALACNLGAGGYNAEFLTADQLASKVQWGIDNLLKVEQQRLTAAEQRNAVMAKALERITRPHDCGCVPCTGSCTSKYALEITLEEIREIAGAALQPTESGASDKCLSDGGTCGLGGTCHMCPHKESGASELDPSIIGIDRMPPMEYDEP